MCYRMDKTQQASDGANAWDHLYLNSWVEKSANPYPYPSSTTLARTPACAECEPNYNMNAERTACQNENDNGISGCERYATSNTVIFKDEGTGMSDELQKPEYAADSWRTGGWCVCPNGQVYEVGIFSDGELACENSFNPMNGDRNTKALIWEWGTTPEPAWVKTKVVCAKFDKSPRDDGCRKCKSGHFMKNQYECLTALNFGGARVNEDLSLLNYFEPSESKWLREGNISASPEGGIRLYLKFKVASDQQITWLMDRDPVVRDEVGKGTDCKCTADPITHKVWPDGAKTSNFGGVCQCQNKMRYVVGSTIEGVDANSNDQLECSGSSAIVKNVGNYHMTTVDGVGTGGGLCECPNGQKSPVGEQLNRPGQGACVNGNFVPKEGISWTGVMNVGDVSDTHVFDSRMTICIFKTKNRIKCEDETKVPAGSFPDDQPSDWKDGYRYHTCVVEKKCEFKRGYLRIDLQDDNNWWNNRAYLNSTAIIDFHNAPGEVNLSAPSSDPLFMGVDNSYVRFGNRVRLLAAVPGAYPLGSKYWNVKFFKQDKENEVTEDPSNVGLKGGDCVCPDGHIYYAGEWSASAGGGLAGTIACVNPKKGQTNSVIYETYGPWSGIKVNCKDSGTGQEENLVQQLMCNSLPGFKVQGDAYHVSDGEDIDEKDRFYHLEGSADKWNLGLYSAIKAIDCEMTWSDTGTGAEAPTGPYIVKLVHLSYGVLKESKIPLGRFQTLFRNKDRKDPTDYNQRYH